MIKRGKFWFPEDDNHFNGENYQVHHRRESLSHCDKFNTAIDVGAHVGTWAVDLQEFFEKVYAFEPVPVHRECLERNVDTDIVEILPYALGDYDGNVCLSYAKDGNSGTSSITEGGDYEAEIRTLDSFGYKDVDYIKIDVEGFELQFLKGAAETIKENRPTINIEVKNTCERFGYKQEDILTYLTELGMIPVGRTVDDWVWRYA
jgi:FkbM family methyltransferase